MNELATSKLNRQLAELFQRVNYERQSTAGPRSFKLQTMHNLMQRLGNPHTAAPVIHVAGTKGKGSVSKMTGEILRLSGLKTGIYSSPHLEKINQRMSINDQLISDEQLSAVLEQMQPVVDSLDEEFAARNERGLTFFEIITSAGMQHFANEQVDAVVLEVGLGGRLDSTNVCQPAVCIITNISLDHTRQLGDTIAKIATEKAGIIKPGVPVVSGALHPEAIEVINAVAADRGSQLFQLDREMHVTRSDDGTFSCNGTTRKPFEVSGLSCGMPGDHQRANAALAIATCKIFADQGRTITDEHLRQGVASATLPGRTEILSRSPFIMMDMAHNGASVDALMQTFVAEVGVDSRNRFIVATTRDKDTAEIIEPLVATADELILTRYRENPRGKSLEELAEAVEASISHRRDLGQRIPRVEIRETPELSWQYLVDSLEHQDAICIAGSAFLVAELRPKVKQWLDAQTSQGST
jgi:dihydrofolate synthase/folylpolyglutamate synthase